jgi:hypothetical protein
MRKTATVERIFGADPERVYAAYWDLGVWPMVLPEIVEVHVHYDDGIHQAFAMVVDKGDGRETVRGARIGVIHRRLELCQFEPPPGFRVMQGEWRFEPGPAGGTRVLAERTFALADPAREGEAATMLEGLLAKNLAAFDAYLSAGR